MATAEYEAKAKANRTTNNIVILWKIPSFYPLMID
jgi:hypothetical protein